MAVARPRKLIPYIVAVLSMGAVVLAFWPLQAYVQGRPGIVAFAEIIVVLLIAVTWGTLPALVASLTGMLAWQFLYLPPYFSFSLSDLSFEDAALLAAFFAASILVGQLSARSKRRAEEAESERKAVELLYAELHCENTERKHAQETLRQSESRIRRLVESNIIGIYFWDIAGGIHDANDAFLRIIGYTREDLAAGALRWSDITPAEHHRADEQAMAELKLTGRCTPYEKEYQQKDGDAVPVLVGGTLFEDSQDKGVGFVLDLTEQKRAEARIRYMAQHDALTGLANRVLFEDRVTQAIAQARRNQYKVAVLFIDLDHFKHVNDSLGHQVGDRLLRVAARRLHRCLREGDSVARLGGDEFVINLPLVEDLNDPALVAGKALETLAQPLMVDGHVLHLTGSIGISLFPTDGDDAEALMRAADTAMYHAKAKGRNNYQFFTPTLNEAARSRLSIANRLHQALDRGEFALHYQPQVDLESGKVSVAEALIRWRQPEGGLLLPKEFIQVAEETGLIAPLGEWVLREACEQLKRWHGDGYSDLRIAVNLSPYQLRRPGFADMAESVLDKVGLSAATLELELTESILMTQSSENVATLERLTDMGIQLAVDDFGTGYSSLSYLQRFPIHTLKIDQSFVSGIGQDSSDVAIVSAVIAMAQSLRLNVVAEGVETAEQAEFLRSRGCPAAQGFYYSTPVTADALGILLNHHDGVIGQASARN